MVKNNFLGRLFVIFPLTAAITACPSNKDKSPPPPPITYNSELDSSSANWTPKSTLLDDGSDYEIENENHAGVLSESGARSDCSFKERDILVHRDELPSWSTQYAELLPGTIINTSDFENGNITQIPIGENRKITLYLSDIAIPNPSITIESSTAADIRSAINELVGRIDSSSIDLPARVSYRSEVTTDEKQFYDSAGVSASFGSSALEGTSISLSFGSGSVGSEGQIVRHILMKLVQPMFTVTFDHSEIQRTSDFFGEVDEVLWNDYSSGKYFDESAPPAFVSSVTYGRMAMFVIYDYSSVSTDTVKQNYGVQGEFAGDAAGLSNENTSGFVKARSEGRLTIFALGGSQDTAWEAITTNDFTTFASTQGASTAVPLSFKVKHLGGNRSDLALRDTTKYTVTDCFRCSEQEVINEVTVYHLRDRHDDGSAGVSGCDAHVSGSVVLRCSQSNSQDTLLGVKGQLVNVGSDDCRGVNWMSNDPSNCSITYSGVDQRGGFAGGRCIAACNYDVTAFVDNTPYQLCNYPVE